MTGKDRIRKRLALVQLVVVLIGCTMSAYGVATRFFDLLAGEYTLFFQIGGLALMLNGLSIHWIVYRGIRNPEFAESVYIAQGDEREIHIRNNAARIGFWLSLFTALGLLFITPFFSRQAFWAMAGFVLVMLLCWLIGYFVTVRQV